MSDEGEAWEPACVEAGGADDNVDVVRLAGVVDKARGCDRGDRVGEYGSVVFRQRLEVSWSWSRPPASGIEVFGYHLVEESWMVCEGGSHFLMCVFSSGLSGGTAFEDEFEALVELVLDLLAVFEVFLRVVFQKLVLLFAVCV